MGVPLNDALQGQHDGSMLPWVVRDLATDEIVGSTRYHDIVAKIDRVEIGYTWYAQSRQRTRVNTTCKLLNFPDKEATAGGTRIVPEVAASLPAVSKDGKTYTFTLKKTYKFADGSGVAAANFAYAFNRDLQPKMSSPATTFEEDIVGAKDVENGKAPTMSGLTAPLTVSVTSSMVWRQSSSKPSHLSSLSWVRAWKPSLR